MAGVKGRSGRKPARRRCTPVRPADGILVVNARKSKRYLEMYQRLYSRLNPLLKDTDELTFNLLVQKAADWIAANERLAADGFTDTEPKTGRIVPSAAFKVERGVFADLLQLCNLFGLAPKLRSVLNPPQQKDPADQAKTIVDQFITDDPGDALS